MVGIILVSENRAGAEMLKTVRRLLGHLNGVKSLALRPGGNLSRIKRAMQKTIVSVDKGAGVLLLTDIFGSTQCNVCCQLLKKGSVEMITGFNLPMLIKLCTLRQTMPLGRLVSFIEKYGRMHIHRVHC